MKINKWESIKIVEKPEPTRITSPVFGTISFPETGYYIREYTAHEQQRMYAQLSGWLRDECNDTRLKLILMRDFGSIELEDIGLTGEKVVALWEEMAGKKGGRLYHHMDYSIYNRSGSATTTARK